MEKECKLILYFMFEAIKAQQKCKLTKHSCIAPCSKPKQIPIIPNTPRVTASFPMETQLQGSGNQQFKLKLDRIITVTNLNKIFQNWVPEHKYELESRAPKNYLVLHISSQYSPMTSVRVT